MRKVFLILVFCFCALSLVAKEFRVSSIDEFNSVASKVKKGDKIIIANGTWFDAHLRIDCTASKDEPLVIRAENKGGFILSGNSKLSLAGKYIRVEDLTFKGGSVATSTKSKQHIVEFRNARNQAENCVLSGCDFDDYSPSDKSLDDVWVSLYGRENIVENCTFQGKDNMGLYIVVWHRGQRSDQIIRNNYFTRPRTYNREQNGQEIIRLGDSHNSLSACGTLIENNVFYECNGEIEIISVKSGENTLRSNYFINSRGALTLRHGNNNIVEGNYFISCEGGVRVINAGHKIFNNYFYNISSRSNRAAISIQTGVVSTPLNGYHKVRDVVIANNTFVDCKNAFALGVKNSLKLSSGERVAPTDEPENVLIYANLVSGSRAENVDARGTDTKGIKFENCEFNARQSGEFFEVQGYKLPKLASKSKVKTLDFIDKDIFGQPREKESRVGAEK